MSKKVIGIAVIAGLDLAFIVLMQAGWDTSEVAQNIQPPDRYQQSLTQKQSLPELEVPIETEAVSDSDESVAATVASQKRRIEPAAPVRAQKHRRTRSRSANTANAGVEFTDTVIYVKRSQPFQFQQVSLVEPKITTPEPITEIRPESKRKSFFSKAAPIVKKPYEWIKDLAEKLK